MEEPEILGESGSSTQLIECSPFNAERMGSILYTVTSDGPPLSNCSTSLDSAAL